MRISRLKLGNVKRHATLDLALAPGLTVVRGPNEAGKSTIQRALELVLFRKPTSTAQELDGVRSWASQESDPEIGLEFDDDGVPGVLRKQFAGPRGSVELRLGDELITDPSAAEARIAELTGLPSEKFFRSTASIRHQELADLDRDEGALRDRLQLSMSGADRGTWAAKRKLEDAIRRYRSEGQRNPGLLRAERELIERLTEEVERGEAELQRLEHDRRMLAEARDRRVALDTQLAEEQAQLEASERAVTLLARLENASARYGRFKRAADLREQVAELEASHPSSMTLASLRSGVERLRALEYQISEQRAQLASEPEEGVEETFIPDPPDPQVWYAAGGGLAVAAVAVALFTAVMNAGLLGIVLAIVLIAAAGGCFGAAYRQSEQAREIRRLQQEREDAIARRLNERAELNEQLRALVIERDRQLAAYNLADLAAAEVLLAAEAEHVATIERVRAEYRGLLGETPPEEDVSVLRDRMAAEAEQMRHALSGMGEIGAAPARSRGRYLSSVRALQSQRERALTEEAQAQARVDQNRVDAEQVASTAEQLDAAREHSVVLDRRLRIYEQTLASINAAEVATMKKAARFLEQRMASDVEHITDGRYRRIQVDENELSFRVYSPERRDWVDVRTLSQGTIDQFYLAARLGLVRQVTQHRHPPLVFDDPFVTFDDARARKALEVLKLVARDHQVIYLTCSDRYDSVADRVIELPAPTGRDIQRPDEDEEHEPIAAPVATADEAVAEREPGVDRLDEALPFDAPDALDDPAAAFLAAPWLGAPDLSASASEAAEDSSPKGAEAIAAAPTSAESAEAAEPEVQATAAIDPGAEPTTSGHPGGSPAPSESVSAAEAHVDSEPIRAQRTGQGIVFPIPSGAAGPRDKGFAWSPRRPTADPQTDGHDSGTPGASTDRSASAHDADGENERR